MLRGEIELRCAFEREAHSLAVMSRDLVEMGLGWTWTAARIRRNIRSADTVVVVAAQGARQCGFGIMVYGDESAHLNLLAVRPRYRRRRLGGSIVRWLEATAAVAGVQVVSLELRADKPETFAFYRSLGYRHLARIPGYYEGRLDALRMARVIAVNPRVRRREPLALPASAAQSPV